MCLEYKGKTIYTLLSISVFTFNAGLMVGPTSRKLRYVVFGKIGYRPLDLWIRSKQRPATCCKLPASLVGHLGLEPRTSRL